MRTAFIAGKLVEVADLKTGIRHAERFEDYPQYKAMTDYTRGLTEEEWRKSKWAGVPLERRKR